MVQQKGRKLHCILMDFGLARLAQTTKLTREGSRLGTAAYMSPEQVQGETVDRRTDIWALGVVIYEMTAGVLPFPSDYEQALFYGILNEAPEPLTAVRSGVPMELERIVSKCLVKESGERYQTCTDLIVDLNALQKTLASGVSRISSAPAGPSAEAPSSNVETTKAHRSTGPQVAAAVLIAALLAGTAGWFAKPSHSPTDWAPAYRISRLTWDSGLTIHPNISRDGRLVAYTSDRDGGAHLDIWVEQTAGGGRVQITDSDEEEQRPTFSPDGSTIAFTRGHDLYLAPALGGSARFLAPKGSWPAFSPDGKSISYAGRGGKLMVVAAAGGEPKEFQSGFSSVHAGLWMPDGKTILFSALERPNDYDWWLTSIDGGERTRTNFTTYQKEHRGLSGLNLTPTWIVRGHSILYGSANSLWRIRWDADSGGYAGRPEALTFGPANLVDASVADDGTIAIAEANSESGIWSIPLANGGSSIESARLNTPTEPTTPSVSRRSGRIAFIGRTGVTDVYLREFDSDVETNITNNRDQESSVVISPDGSLVAYESRLRRNSEIRVYSVESGQNRTLCEDCGVPTSWSRDNQYLLVSWGEPSVISRVNVADGLTNEIIRFGDDREVFGARCSPDGRWIALSEGKKTAPITHIWMTEAGSTPIVTEDDCIALTEGEHANVLPRWSPDGDMLYFVSDRAGNKGIWSMSLRADKSPRSEPTPVRLFETTRFSMDTMSDSEIGLEVGTDRLYFTQREITGSIHLMRPREAE